MSMAESTQRVNEKTFGAISTIVSRIVPMTPMIASKNSLNMLGPPASFSMNVDCHNLLDMAIVCIKKSCPVVLTGNDENGGRACPLHARTQKFVELEGLFA